ncbi:hypothetical protein ELQ90_03085 [Labedella phragmitis]|uniref:Phage gp6-like head-tail connector protein n=1 Tax=Labedella phragmitis TaxID=2498849 RepID=A0A444PYG6_9MICO|nr:hypothetical protein [Labedella phragmitis]RWZ52934.1 hypothetical protein ELQ90_03085 [Labedella phragmitis]
MTDSTARDATDTTLEWYVNAIGEDADFAAASAATATSMVHEFIGGEDNPFKVPADVVARAVLEVGADLYYRKASRNGVVGLEGTGPQPFRINRDPMTAAYPLLRPYLVMGL